HVAGRAHRATTPLGPRNGGGTNPPPGVPAWTPQHVDASRGVGPRRGQGLQAVVTPALLRPALDHHRTTHPAAVVGGPPDPESHPGLVGHPARGGQRQRRGAAYELDLALAGRSGVRAVPTETRTDPVARRVAVED